MHGLIREGDGLTDNDVVKGAKHSAMNTLAEATQQADKVLVF